MDITYSLLIAVFISFLLIFTKFSIIRGCITWFRNIIHLRSLPSPPGHWLLGHALKFDMSPKLMMYLQENQRKFPKFCVYWIGPFLPLVFTGDAETMKLFMHQSGESPRPLLYRFFSKWLGEGLLTSIGTKWKKHRKMLTPAFHSDVLKQCVPVYNEVSHKLLEIWSSLADSGESIDITEYTKPFAMEVLLKFLYSKNNDCLEKMDSKSSFFIANDTLASLSFERMFVPYYAFDWIYFSTDTGRKYLQCCDIVHKYSDDVIMEKRKELLQGVQRSQQSRKHQDFIDILLSIKDENGEGLTDREIREEADTFMSAGHHTVAATLGWCLYSLAKYKEHQEMCRKEIRDILTGRESATIIWEDLSKLDYITMCIKESLRLYTIVPFVGKLSSEDVVVNGYKIPKGTYIGIGLNMVHHDPLVWNDPEKFDPMRFSDKCKNMTFVPFSAGPRNCIGQRFALHQLKVTVANILNKFKLEIDTSHEIQPDFSTLHESKNGIKIKLYSAA